MDGSAAPGDPAGWLADLAGRARVHHTPGGGGAMVWHDWGDGVPMVLLHGGHGSWNHWCRTIEPLIAAGYRVLAADLPGLGDSDDPGPPYTAEGLAEIVAHGIARLVPGAAFHLAGFSFGAVIGAVVAEQLDGRVLSFNMVGAAGFGPRPREPGSLVRIHPGMEADELRAAARTNMEWLMIADPAFVDELAIHIQITNSLRARTVSRPLSNTTRLLDALGGLLAPVNAVWGSRDRTLAGGGLDQRIALLRETRPDTNVEVLDGIGHWTQYEAAADYAQLLVTMSGGAR